MRRVLSLDMGTVSIGFALLEEPCTILKWGIINLGTNDTRQAIEQFHKLLSVGGDFAWLMASPDVNVVMESQPTHGAPKCVSHALQMFCLDHNLHYEFMAANDKLKLIKTLYESEAKSTRAERKTLCMKQGQHLLELNPTYAEFYSKHLYKQRTDLMDALVQGARWLQRQKRCTTAQFLEANLKLDQVTERAQTQTLVDAADQTTEAHADEFANNFKKRKFGEIIESHSRTAVFDG